MVMQNIRNIFLVSVVLVMSAMAGPVVADGDAKGGLFINLTTDDTWSAAKAIMFAHEKALKGGHEPVVIWLNVRGVYLADKKRASHVPGPMRGADTSIQQMLDNFMTAGGRVLMCQACSGAAGLTLDDYIEGVEMGDWPTIESLLWQDGMQTLAW